MDFLLHWIGTVSAPTVALIGVVLATTGWLYTARRSRNLNRKVHTFNALLQTSFNDKYHKELALIRPYVRKDELPKFGDDEDKCELRSAFVFILNHYEFIAAGIRNGDISERLLKDSERGTVIRIFETARKFIASTRDARGRRTTFEHIEWLYVRWKEEPPGIWQQFIEWLIQRPLYHNRHRWVALAIVGAAAFMLAVAYLHLLGEPFNPLLIANAAASTR